MELETFFEQFELLADAPNGVQKLRELILQLAVQGKLVPQDPNDEPVSVLLEKIEAEKKQLVYQGKINKEKKLPPIRADKVPFELPDNWVGCHLGEIIQISSGDALTSSEMVSSGQIPVYGGNGITGYHNQHNVDKPTLVIGRVGYYCGSVHLTPNKAWITDNAFITYFSESNIDIHFLYWLLKGTDLQVNNKATAQPVISGRKVYPIIIGLPPLPEQHRIVTKVDRLMSLCDELEARQKKRHDRILQLGEVATSQLLTSSTPEAFNQHWQGICDNFDLLYSTPKNVSQLRQAILQLAVMGKLVPQDPNDEPASVLLERIREEKERLVKEEKIKKSEKLPPVEVDEMPFELPDGWELVRLGELLVFGPRNGYSPKPVDYVTPVKSLTLSATTSGKFNNQYLTSYSRVS